MNTYYVLNVLPRQGSGWMLRLPRRWRQNENWLTSNWLWAELQVAAVCAAHEPWLFGSDFFLFVTSEMMPHRLLGRIKWLYFIEISVLNDYPNGHTWGKKDILKKKLRLGCLFQCVTKSDCIDESQDLSVVGALLLAGFLVIITLPSIGWDGASGKKT